MTTRKRGLREPIVYLYNPLPKTTEEALLEDAGLELIEPSGRDPFEVEWTYGTGFERETIRIPAGEFFPLRQSEAKEALRQLKELGVVQVHTDDSEDPDVRIEAATGLKRAASYWSERGYRRVADFRKAKGIGKEELEEYTYDLWPYFLGEAKAKAARKALDELRRSNVKKHNKVTGANLPTA